MTKKTTITRRQLLETTALGGLAIASARGAETDLSSKGIPTRILGRTGARVSILAMGGGSRFLAYGDEEKALQAMNHALDLGISYVDTAYAYGQGLSETRVGKVMATRRKEVFLATKCPERNGDKAMKIIEGGLKRLQTSQLDLIHIHMLTTEEDLAAIEAKDGVLQTLYKLRDQKVTRFIGITCHTDPTVLKTALERHDFDCTQMALNAARVGMGSGKNGMVPNEAMKISFEDVALPVARHKKMGVIAMKVFAQEALVGQAPVEKLLYYSLSLPGVTLAVAGMPKFEYIDQNVALAKAFKPLPPAEMKQISGQLADHNKAALDRFFSTHVDA
jgi:aryl-alcohol dehydrogenase-like predicted oxidoreductase